MIDWFNDYGIDLMIKWWIVNGLVQRFGEQFVEADGAGIVRPREAE